MTDPLRSDSLVSGVEWGRVWRWQRFLLEIKAKEVLGGEGDECSWWVAESVSITRGRPQRGKEWQPVLGGVVWITYPNSATPLGEKEPEGRVSTGNQGSGRTWMRRFTGGLWTGLDTSSLTGAFPASLNRVGCRPISDKKDPLKDIGFKGGGGGQCWGHWCMEPFSTS